MTPHPHPHPHHEEGRYLLGARQGKRGLWRWSLKDGRSTVARGAGSWRTLDEAMAAARRALRLDTIEASEARASRIASLEAERASARARAEELQGRVEACTAQLLDTRRAASKALQVQRWISVALATTLIGLALGALLALT